MATIAKIIFSPSYSATSNFVHNESILSRRIFSSPLIRKKARVSSMKLQANYQSCYLVKGTGTIGSEKSVTGDKKIHCSEEYDRGLQFFSKGEKLVIAHFSSSWHEYDSKIGSRFVEEQLVLWNEVKFLHVTADESEKTMQLCRREKIDRVPYFVFYKKNKRVHEVAGFKPKRLMDDVLYYGYDPFSPVVRLRSKQDLTKLIEAHKLVVVNVGTYRCSPCVKIYPSVVKLAEQMAGGVVFARMNVDENEWCVRKYVGSSVSTLIREIVRLQGKQRVKNATVNAVLTFQ